MELIFLAVGLIFSTPIGFIILFQDAGALGLFAAVMTALVLLSLFLGKALAPKLPQRAHLILPRFWLGATFAAFAAALAFAWRARSQAPADGFCMIGGAHVMPYACISLAATAFTYWRSRTSRKD